MPSNVVTPILSRLALLIFGEGHRRAKREPPNQAQSVDWT